MTRKLHLIVSSILLVAIVVFGFTHRTGSESKEMISWSSRTLVWEDFKLMNYMEEDYVASITSDIACPELITEGDSKVYAFMNPNESERLRDEHDSYNVLTHEQYHFNITEYCARLLRKEIVEKGLDGLSFKEIQSLRLKYHTKLEKLQTEYDSITDHNSNTREQRYWELRIDDWLRQTDYYKEEDIYKYYDFTKNRTRFFRHVYFTFKNRVLTSYPIAEKDIAYGEAYEVWYDGPKECTVKFYKDGELANGGYFDTAIAKILETKKGHFEIQYLTVDGKPNSDLDFSYLEKYFDEANRVAVRYFDGDKKRISKKKIYETRWRFDQEKNTYTATYYDEGDKRILNSEGMYKEERTLDSLGRTYKYKNYGKDGKLRNDSNQVAIYERAYNKHHKRSWSRLYDQESELAYHISDYYLSFDYDERGNVIRVRSLDEYDKPTYDTYGASIYEYTYDFYNRETTEKRFNKDYKPIIANDDYFQKVTDYDSKGRPLFEAYYYPGYVLKYSDSKWGATEYKYEGDSIVMERNLNAYGNLLENKDSVAIVKKKFNEKKQLISETYLNPKGHFIKTDDHVVKNSYEYDQYGNTVKQSVFDSIGNLTAFELDVAIVRWVYDENGNKLETSYYNVRDEIADAKENVSFNVYEYNRQNQLIRRTNFDKDRKPGTINGVFERRFFKNRKGLDSIVEEYQTNGKLKKGVCRTKYYYNRFGNKVKTEFYDKNNRRVKNNQGVSAIKTVYDRRQAVRSYTYLDTFDKPINNTSGIAKELWELNDLGHTLTYSCYDENGQPTTGSYGYHQQTNEWGSVGEITKTTLYDVNLELTEDTNGTAIYEYRLNSSGMYQEIRRFDKNKKLANNKYGVAISKYTPSLNGLYYLDEELNELEQVVSGSQEQ